MSKTMALTIDPDGSYHIHHFQGVFITLDHLRKIHRNTYFEAVNCGPASFMWIDEDGLSKGLPTNDHACRIAERIALRSIRIVGSVTFTGPANGEGETLGLSVPMMSDLVDLIH